MQRLCNAVAFPGGRPARPERVLQFGEGVFLRAFVDDLIDDLNARGAFDGSVVVVQPRPGGAAKVRALNEQDGLYTLLLRGIEGGQRVERRRIISSISRGIDPYGDYDTYMAVVRGPDLRFVASNTTEAGIAYRAEDKFDDRPPIGFPGKVAQLLHARYRHFDGDPSKGLIFLPCELIDDNGAELRRIVLRHAADWGLDSGFAQWVAGACTFANTLVDRIVTGYPAAEAEALRAQLGYEDDLLDAAEPYSFFGIEGAPQLAEELPTGGASIHVLLTADIAPYKRRKVRILNGAHTALAAPALLMGHETVREGMADPLLRWYLTRLIHREVIPNLDMPRDELESFAASAFERFDNPFIAHRLAGIAMNTASKWRARLLPSLRDHLARTSALPELIAFSLAASLALFEQGRADIVDSGSVSELYGELLGIGGLRAPVEAARADIAKYGCRKALEMRL